MNEESSNDASLQTIDERGNAPKSRIKDAGKAWALFSALKNEYDLTARYRQKIKGLIDGNPPYDRELLERNAMAWRSNVNFREAEAIIESNAASIWELEMEVPQLITVRCDTKDLDPQAQATVDYGGVIAEEYTRTLQHWSDYYYHRMLCTGEMLKMGIGPVFWPDEYDWRFKALAAGSFLVPGDTRASAGEIDLVIIRHTYRAHELFQKIKDPESIELADEEGWNVDMVKEAILLAARQKPGDDKKFQTSAWESIQQMLKDNDLSASYVSCDPIQVAHLLVTELESGKVSHFIILEQEEKEKFLFESPDRFDSMANVVCAFLWNIGDGYYRSIKGLGHRIYPHVELSNRFANTMLDGAMLSSSMILQPSTGAGRKAMTLTRIGPVTVLPDGFTPIQSSFAPRLDQLVGVRTMLQQILNNNTGVYKKAVEHKDMPERTAREVSIDEMKSARFEKNQIQNFYIYSDQMHRETFRRVVNPDYPENAPGYKEAKEFRDRCIKRGVPKQLLTPERCEVFTTRAIGFGSPVMRASITQDVMNVSPALDETGRVNAVRDWLAARVGYSMVDRYKTMSSRDPIPTNETSIAMLENNDIASGQSVVVGTDQLHWIHITMHLPPLIQAAQAFRQNPTAVDPQAIVRMLAGGLMHLQGHIGLLAADASRKGQLDSLKEPMKFLDETRQLAERNLQQIMEAQQKQAQEQQALLAQAQQVLQDREIQTKLAEIQSNAQVKLTNVQLQDRIRTAKARHGMQLADMKAAADIRRKQMGITGGMAT